MDLSRRASRVLFLALTLTQIGASQQLAGWRLVWWDEFNDPALSPIDKSKWVFDKGDGSPRNPGWGNHELQSYSDSTQNVFLDGRHLVIRAIKTGINSYTSGRLKTKHEFQYGRVEARIKPSYTQGVWQAFWMLGASYSTIAWPICGEIDITEMFGSQGGKPRSTRGTIHGPGYAGAGVTESLDVPVNLADDFHVFAMEWDKDSIQMFVDGKPFRNTFTPASLPAGGTWVFNAPFFLVLNVAVGGYPAPVGYPDRTTKFPAEMLVDYVRVWQK